jgi:hypothetical protein
MFWSRFTVPLSVIPRLENVVFQLTDEVRVLCVIACGLYIDVRLLRSKLDVAKFTRADSVVKGFALASCVWFH